MTQITCLRGDHHGAFPVACIVHTGKRYHPDADWSGYADHHHDDHTRADAMTDTVDVGTPKHTNHTLDVDSDRSGDATLRDTRVLPID